MNEISLTFQEDKPIATLISTGKAFTGYAISNDINGKLEIRQEFKKGSLKIEKYYFPNGNVKSCMYYDEYGREDGKYTEWDSLGTISIEGEYLKGTKQGIWTFFEKGKVTKMGEYTLGKMNGVWKYLDSNGNIIKREFYINGEIQKTEYY